MRKPAILSAIVLALYFVAGKASAQVGGPMMMEPSGGGGGGKGREERGGIGQYRTFTFSAPLTITKETVARLEFNLAGKASLALEGMYKREREEVSEKDHEETGESQRAKGQGGAIFVSRYMDGAAMGGLFWGLGVGYREETIRWRVAPEKSDKQVNMALADKDKMLNHDAELKGTTGHLRVGYRFITPEIPVTFGGYIGGRHFQAGVTDGEPSDEDEDAKVKKADMTDDEKERLRRQYTTKPEAGVELGVTF